MEKDSKQSSKGDGGIVKRTFRYLKTPSSRYSFGFLTIGGVIFGILFWGGFHWALEVTNTEPFCISCHEMSAFVYEEYKDTIHYTNRTGVRATCPDCHVPKEWNHKLVRKMYASNELLHKALGSINTREKFEAKRLYMAQNVWASMKKSDSRECRNCHENRSMDYFEQEQRGVEAHIKGEKEGQTCIDCHKGIAHSLPELYEVDPSAVLGAKGGS